MNTTIPSPTHFRSYTLVGFLCAAFLLFPQQAAALRFSDFSDKAENYIVEVTSMDPVTEEFVGRVRFQADQRFSFEPENSTDRVITCSYTPAEKGFVVDRSLDSDNIAFAVGTIDCGKYTSIHPFSFDTYNEVHFVHAPETYAPTFPEYMKTERLPTHMLIRSTVEEPTTEDTVAVLQLLVYEKPRAEETLIPTATPDPISTMIPNSRRGIGRREIPGKPRRGTPPTQYENKQRLARIARRNPCAAFFRSISRYFECITNARNPRTNVNDPQIDMRAGIQRRATRASNLLNRLTNAQNIQSTFHDLRTGKRVIIGPSTSINDRAELNTQQRLFRRQEALSAHGNTTRLTSDNRLACGSKDGLRLILCMNELRIPINEFNVPQETYDMYRRLMDE